MAQMDPAFELAMRLRAAYLTMRRTGGAFLEPHGATADQFVLLTTILNSGGATQQELVRRTASDPNTIRAMLMLLERRGLVTRSDSKQDARALNVNLTIEGRKLQRRLARYLAGLLGALFHAFTDGERQTLSRMLEQIADVMAVAHRNRRGKKSNSDGLKATHARRDRAGLK